MLLLCATCIFGVPPHNIFIVHWGEINFLVFDGARRSTTASLRCLLWIFIFFFCLVSASSFLLLVYCTLPHQFALWMQSTSIRVRTTCVNILWQRHIIRKHIEKTFRGARSLTFTQHIHTTPLYWSINNDIDFWFHLLITFDWLLLCVYGMCKYMRFIEKGAWGFDWSVFRSMLNVTCGIGFVYLLYIQIMPMPAKWSSRTPIISINLCIIWFYWPPHTI